MPGNCFPFSLLHICIFYPSIIHAFDILYRKLAGKLTKIVQQRSNWIWNIHTHTQCALCLRKLIFENTHLQSQNREPGETECDTEEEKIVFSLSSFGDTCSLSSELCNTLRSVFVFRLGQNRRAMKMGSIWFWCRFNNSNTISRIHNAKHWQQWIADFLRKLKRDLI